MVTEQLPSLYPTPIDVAAPPGRGLHGYYRKTNGWITTAPTTPSNQANYRYKGFTFLEAYGEFKNDAKGTSGYNEVDARGVGWDPTVERWRLIFQRGGAKEFPVDQIIALRWHVNPPYREVEFPQLGGVEIHDLPCPECNRFFSSTNRNEAVAQLRTHLTAKVNDAHSYTPTDLRELGKEWGINFDSARIGRSAAMAPAAQEPQDEEEIADLTPTASFDDEDEDEDEVAILPSVIARPKRKTTRRKRAK